VSASGFALFDTTIGHCGVGWGERGIASVWLPEGDDGATLGRIRRRHPQAIEQTPPVEVNDAIARMQALLRGTPDDLAEIVLDLADVPVFQRRVYAIARAIRPGATLSYGELAAALGEPTAARAVGQALGANPCPIIVPCHRVLAAGTRSGGFSAPGGARTKLRLLEIEGASFGAEPGLFDRR
jgi:methylated-DNA-[protein]-cysteine S-methyltransferase